MQWVAGVVETFGFQHSEIMRMPFRTFVAYNRVATARNVNANISRKFSKQLLG